MKKIAILLICVLMAGVATMFTGCNGGGKRATVMNLSLNPKIELILDAENKVVSVSALNEEGNLIVQAEAFVGLTAEQAAKQFAEICEETGYLMEGQVNEIQIAISGANQSATTLYNSVKAQIESYLTEENVSATVTKAAAITEAQLRALVRECEPYLDAASMQYEELVATLKASRDETKNMYSEELKRTYYALKEAALRTAEMEALAERVDVAERLVINTAKITYQNTMQSLIDLQNGLLVAEDSVYQEALSLFQEAKTEYLNFVNYVQSLPEGQVTTAMQQQLTLLENALTQAEGLLANAKQTAEDSLALVRTQLTQVFDAMIASVENYAKKTKEHASAIATKQQAAKVAFFAQFEADYADALQRAKTAWEQMEEALDDGYQAQ